MDSSGKLIAAEVAAVVVLAAMVAMRLAALLMTRYLAGGAEHTPPMAFWTLLFALLAALARTAFAAVRHAWRGMALRPAAAVRS